MKKSSVFILGAAVSIALTAPAYAASKGIVCERYQIGADGLKTSVFTYTTTADFNAGVVSLRLDSEPKDNKTGAFPIPVGKDWKIVWHSKDQMRVVALKAGDVENPFSSPVFLLDLDFANVRMRYHEAGGLTDFDTVVSDPWKFECKRTD